MQLDMVDMTSFNPFKMSKEVICWVKVGIVLFLDIKMRVKKEHMVIGF